MRISLRELKLRRIAALIALMFYLELIPIKRKSRTYYSPIPKANRWFEDTVPMLPCGRYKYFFRVTRGQYKTIEALVIGTKDDRLLKGAISVEKRVHLLLYYLGNNPDIEEGLLYQLEVYINIVEKWWI